MASPRGPQLGQIVTPASSIERAEDAGLRAHTNVVVKSLDGVKPFALTSSQTNSFAGITPDTVTTIETPESLGCLYVQSPNHVSTGCVPNFYAGHGGGPSSAGWGAIALVDAYDNPNASTDLTNFDKYFGLPAAHFTKIEMGNSCTSPPPDPGWALEESLDIEWSHVYAPKAEIVLVEACSSSYGDLLAAESEAIAYIQYYYGGGQVSNSWGSGEFSGENSYDGYFTAQSEYYYIPEVTFASAGDSGCGAAYPSSNPWLVSAGGTTVNRNASTYTFNNESCWSGSGGGTSAYETTGAATDYQYPIFGGGAARQTPDFAHDADPNSPVAIYAQYYGQYYGVCTTYPTCFFGVGGTSVASPSLAGIVNRSSNKLSTWFGNYVDSYGFFYAGENTLLYSQLETATAYYKNFYDITTGSNGCTVTYQWDYCTGVGSPRGLLGK